MGHLWKTLIEMAGKGEDEITAPPARVLDVEVIAGEAHLDVYDVEDLRGRISTESQASIRVDAHSLLRTLQVGLDDDAAPDGK